MAEQRPNYYGSLCAELYDILHETAPQDELGFYLSYARRGERILEALCGSGRFLVPFMKEGYDITGLDLSGEMLERLRRKAPDARVVQADILAYAPEEKFDYIFISSGSVSLFTDISLCKRILRKLKGLLATGGRLVFAVDTVANRCPDSNGYTVSASVQTEAGRSLVLKTKNYYDERTQTQFSPGIYELYEGAALLQSETMDFQTHLYRFGEMEQYLAETGFTAVKTYASFSKDPAASDQDGMFLFACG